ncbi:ATP-dependent RNA helicase DDX51-like [Saccostrea echinata]|uniref:ATP-dependent RNA helicase DDX51-like n=1 Tax=Saccostrea echinata TaxID=191078 RepID=UPI002A819EAA|nr:ATP-dependent RNA helicase DDX51-like [Saccostrea echinata]
MALFAITRYTGDEKEEAETETRAGLILKKLKADAEARKKQRGTEKSQQNITKKKTDRKRSAEKTKKKKLTHKKALKSSEPQSGQKSIALKCDDTDYDDDDDKKKMKFDDKSCENKEKSADSDSYSTDHKGAIIPDSTNIILDNTDNSSSMRQDIDEEERGGSLLGEDEQEGLYDLGGFTVLGNYKTRATEKVCRVLPDWLASPSVIASDLKQKTTPVSEFKGLDPQIHRNLEENQIEYFFPVQIQVIPEILQTVHNGFVLGRAGMRPPDICVSAPTGSGKTLAYVLPIVHALKSRTLCRVRALVVLPVRDLAAQVYKVFLQYTKGTNLKVGMIVGQKQFSVEQHALVKQRLGGYESKVDIVVATPGRLVDHINNTPGFSLSDLRFLVIDEADRIMEHVKQDWLSHVENAAFIGGREASSSLNVYNTSKHQMPLQKLLFSATLSQNPEKLQQLNLFQPRLFTSVVDSTPHSNLSTETRAEVVEGIHDRLNDTGKEVKGHFVGKYTTPIGLKEYTVKVEATEKPLAILHFLHNLKYRHILCFTNSVESTHRLYHLLRLYGDISVAEITSKLQASRRSKVLRKFQNGDIDILICSDAMARGMDIDNVKFVISYDPPPYIKTYIHRVGRTARAGKEGTALTLLQKKEFHHFKTMTKEAGKTYMEKFKVNSGEFEDLMEGYQKALAQLPHILKNEKFPKR